MLKIKRKLRSYQMKILTDIFWRIGLIVDDLDYNKKWRKHKLIREITAYISTQLEEFNSWLEYSGLI